MHHPKLLHHGRPVLLWLLGLIIAFSDGCATTRGTAFLYNHADWLLTRQLDGYFALSRTQKAFVAARLESIHQRHRQEALPRYEAVLNQVRARIEQGLTGADLDWVFLQYDQLHKDLLGRFVQDGVEFVRLIEDRQLVRLKKSLEQRLAKQEQLIRESPEVRSAERAQRMVAVAAEWLGPLTVQQRQEILRLATAFPDTLPVVYRHQLKRKDDLLAILAARDEEDSRIRLSEWLVNDAHNASPAFLEATRLFQHHVAQLVLALDRLATPQQRGHLMAKLDDFARTIHGLSQT